MVSQLPTFQPRKINEAENLDGTKLIEFWMLARKGRYEVRVWDVKEVDGVLVKDEKSLYTYKRTRWAEARKEFLHQWLENGQEEI